MLHESFDGNSIQLHWRIPWQTTKTILATVSYPLYLLHHQSLQSCAPPARRSSSRIACRRSCAPLRSSSWTKERLPRGERECWSLIFDLWSLLPAPCFFPRDGTTIELDGLKTVTCSANFKKNEACSLICVLCNLLCVVRSLISDLFPAISSCSKLTASTRACGHRRWPSRRAERRERRWWWNQVRERDTVDYDRVIANWLGRSWMWLSGRYVCKRFCVLLGRKIRKYFLNINKVFFVASDEPKKDEEEPVKQMPPSHHHHHH